MKKLIVLMLGLMGIAYANSIPTMQMRIINESECTVYYRLFSPTDLTDTLSLKINNYTYRSDVAGKILFDQFEDFTVRVPDDYYKYTQEAYISDFMNIAISEFEINTNTSVANIRIKYDKAQLVSSNGSSKDLITEQVINGVDVYTLTLPCDE